MLTRWVSCSACFSNLCTSFNLTSMVLKTKHNVVSVALFVVSISAKAFFFSEM